MTTKQRKALETALDALETCTYDDCGDSEGAQYYDNDKVYAAHKLITEALAEPEAYTYKSTQSTNCAGCGQDKHTPLRIDAMGGYVCLTCIDQKLGSILGEFGYPDPTSEALAEPAPRRLTVVEIDLVWMDFQKRNYPVGHADFVAYFRAIEARIFGDKS